MPSVCDLTSREVSAACHKTPVTVRIRLYSSSGMFVVTHAIRSLLPDFSSTEAEEMHNNNIILNSDGEGHYSVSLQRVLVDVAERGDLPPDLQDWVQDTSSPKAFALVPCGSDEGHYSMRFVTPSETVCCEGDTIIIYHALFVRVHIVHRPLLPHTADGHPTRVGGSVETYIPPYQPFAVLLNEVRRLLLAGKVLFADGVVGSDHGRVGFGDMANICLSIDGVVPIVDSALPLISDNVSTPLGVYLISAVQQNNNNINPKAWCFGHFDLLPQIRDVTGLVRCTRAATDRAISAHALGQARYAVDLLERFAAELHAFALADAPSFEHLVSSGFVAWPDSDRLVGSAVGMLPVAAQCLCSVYRGLGYCHFNSGPPNARSNRRGQACARVAHCLLGILLGGQSGSAMAMKYSDVPLLYAKYLCQSNDAALCREGEVLLERWLGLLPHGGCAGADARDSPRRRQSEVRAALASAYLREHSQIGQGLAPSLRLERALLLLEDALQMDDSNLAAYGHFGRALLMRGIASASGDADRARAALGDSMDILVEGLVRAMSEGIAAGRGDARVLREAFIWAVRTGLSSVGLADVLSTIRVAVVGDGDGSDAPLVYSAVYTMLGKVIGNAGGNEGFSCCLYQVALSLDAVRVEAALGHVQSLMHRHLLEEACRFIVDYFADQGDLLVSSCVSSADAPSIRDLVRVVAHIGDIQRCLSVGASLGPVAAKTCFSGEFENFAPERAVAEVSETLQYATGIVCMLMRALFCLGRLDAFVDPTVGFLFPALRSGPSKDDHSMPLVRNELAYLWCIGATMKHIPWGAQGSPSPCSPLYCVGDSHVLGLAWQPFVSRGDDGATSPMVGIPLVAAGLKLWHLREDDPRDSSRLYTYAAFYSALDRVPDGAEVLLSIGEIDVREGVMRSVERNLYPSARECMGVLAAIYRGVLERISHRFKRVYVLYPPCVLDQTRAMGLMMWDVFNEELFASEAPPLPSNVIPLRISYTLTPDGYALGAQYQLDGTHLNPSYVSGLYPQMVEEY